jgi:hypothetical protein
VDVSVLSDREIPTSVSAVEALQETTFLNTALMKYASFIKYFCTISAMLAPVPVSNTGTSDPLPPKCSKYPMFAEPTEYDS